MERRYYDRKLETISREDFLEMQWKELEKQIRYVYEKSDFYRRRFREAKITPNDIKTREDFRNKVPITTKQDLLIDQQERPPYGTRLAVPENEVFWCHVTGGTSGKGNEVFVYTAEDYDTFLNYIVMIYTWIGWKKGDRVMNPLPMGMAGAPPVLFNALQRSSCQIFNVGPYDTKTRIQYMRQYKVNCVLCTPAYLGTLTAEAEKQGLDPARDLSVRSVLMFTSAYPVSFIHNMEKKWNAKIYDYYGSAQHALGCNCEKGAVIGEQRGYYHLYDYMAYHEILNPKTGKPVSPGEQGEMVVTMLNHKASPVLRYRQFDKVRYFPHDACDCGRPFSLVESGTIARYDDMIKMKGINIWPETVDEAVLTKDEIAEYQGRVYISDDWKEKVEIVVEFKVGVAEDVKPRLMSKIVDELRDRTGIGFIVKEATEELPRTDFKVRRWTDERAKGLGAKV